MNIYSECVLKTYNEKVNEIIQGMFPRGEGSPSPNSTLEELSPARLQSKRGKVASVYTYIYIPTLLVNSNIGYRLIYIGCLSHLPIYIQYCIYI